MASDHLQSMCEAKFSQTFKKLQQKFRRNLFTQKVFLSHHRLKAFVDIKTHILTRLQTTCNQCVKLNFQKRLGTDNKKSCVTFFLNKLKCIFLSHSRLKAFVAN